MLILTRYSNQCIFIGENKEIIIKILNVSENGRVTLSITAPKSVPILRDNAINLNRNFNRE